MVEGPMQQNALIELLHTACKQMVMINNIICYKDSDLKSKLQIEAKFYSKEIKESRK